MTQAPLGIGFIGSGFMTRFHLQAFPAVRGAGGLGIWSPTSANAEEAAGLGRTVAEARRTLEFPHPDIESFVPAVATGEWRPRS